MRWTGKRVRQRARARRRQGQRLPRVSAQPVADGWQALGERVPALGERVPANRQTARRPTGPTPPTALPGSPPSTPPPRRPWPPGHLAVGDPVIAVDPTKQEWVGDCQNGGREGRPKGEPEAVRFGGRTA